MRSSLSAGPRLVRATRPGWGIRQGWRATRVDYAVTLVAASLLLVDLLVVQASIGSEAVFALPLAMLAVALLVVNPRVELSLALLLVYLGGIDGFLKLKTGSSTITLARDAVLWSIAVGMLARALVTGQHLRLPRYGALVCLFVAIVLAQGLNPSSASPRADLGGFRQHLEFVPLFFIAAVTLRDAGRLRAFFGLLLLVALLNGIVGLIQFNLSPSGLAAWGPGYSNLINGTGAFANEGRTFLVAGVGHPRPPALGSDEGFGGALGDLAIPGGLLLLGQARRWRTRIAVIVGLVGAAAGVITSQSRLALAVAIGAALFYALLTAATPGRRRQLAAVAFAIIAMYLFVDVFLQSNNSPGEVRYNDISLSGLAANRGSSLALIPQYLGDYPFGNGIGRSGPAAFSGGASSGLNAENEFNLLTTEVGIPGLLVMLALWLRVLWDGTAVALSRRDGYGDCVAAMIAALMSAAFIWLVATTSVSSPDSPFFWLCLGVVAGAVGATRPTLSRRHTP